MTPDPNETTDAVVGSSESSNPAPRYSVQLHDAYVVELSASRRLVDTDEAAGGTTEGGTIEVAQPDSRREDDGRRFSVVWRATVVTTAGEMVAEIACAVEGQFASEEPLSQEDFDQFRSREAFVLLWPYVRAAVGEAGRMLGVPVPPLPTIDVRSILGLTNVEAEEEQNADPASG